MEPQLKPLAVAERADGALLDVIWPEGGVTILQEAIEARAVVEGAIARLSAHRRTAVDLARLTHALEAMQSARCDRNAFNDGDLAFHAALSRASHNRVLAGTMATLDGAVREMIACSSEAAFRDGRVDDLVDAHARLVDAVRRRDADAAAGIVSEMMNRLREETAVPHTPSARTLSMVGQSARASKGDRS
jgi:DNA-binding FadR family transcriptional regulator